MLQWCKLKMMGFDLICVVSSIMAHDDAKIMYKNKLEIFVMLKFLVLMYCYFKNFYFKNFYFAFH